MPPDRSVDFDFTRRGLLVFDADPHPVVNGNLQNDKQMAPLISRFEVDEFNLIIQKMAKVKMQRRIIWKCRFYSKLYDY